MNTQELLKQVRDLKELQTMAEELEKEMEAIKDILKAEMTAQNVEELSVDVFKIRYKEVTSNRFDSTSFKEKYQDLYKQFTKAITTKRFSIV